jgi:hypothetical protein
MGMKGRVMELLRAGDEQGLGALVAAEPRAIRFLLGRLWDPDEDLRRRSAHVLGVAAAAHPDIGTDIMRRMMWALNDESATNGRFAIAVIGEIGFHCRELVAPFVAPLASLAWDDGLRLEILRTLHRIAEAHPDLVRPVCPSLVEFVDQESPSEREAFARLLEESGGFHEA